MALVLRQPAAVRQLRRREVIIEPLFADVRERQRLIRFHRRGLNKAKVEFSLHCAAYNLYKVALHGPSGPFFVLYLRGLQHWRAVAAVWMIFPHADTAINLFMSKQGPQISTASDRWRVGAPRCPETGRSKRRA
jgi:hypothetical protein